MNEAKMLLGLGFAPPLPVTHGFPCPALHDAVEHQVWDAEMGGTRTVAGRKPAPKTI